LTYLYKSDGTENNLIIGNFTTDLETDTEVNVNGVADNYYYIDDISVELFNYEFPNVMTPNNDNVNDTFHFNVDLINPTEVNIYDRWGVKVYKSLDKYSWDGKMSNGTDCVAGTYYYVIYSEHDMYKGFIELIK
ncbi:MAG: gliding motility-associated C-terminal domain-containing protein, partial [Bacteroidia bacterium]|nr:gliding motility-associated C-terminal domain-containing protein [Bacteroidia bacterium]